MRIFLLKMALALFEVSARALLAWWFWNIVMPTLSVQTIGYRQAVMLVLLADTLTEKWNTKD